MEETRKTINGRVIAGVLIIVFGFLILLENMHMLQEGFIPAFIISSLGIIIIVNSRKKLLGVIFLIIGIFIFLTSLPGVNGEIVFPALMIAFGIYVIFRNRRPVTIPTEVSGPGYENKKGFFRFDNPGSPVDRDTIDEIAIFGGGHKSFFSESFKGGNITAVFGGHEIDLTRCKLADGENVLEVLTIFGGCEITVPRDWSIILNVTPLFGGFSDKRFKDPNFIPDPAKTLVIKGLVIFGGGELKAY